MRQRSGCYSYRSATVKPETLALFIAQNESGSQRNNSYVFAAFKAAKRFFWARLSDRTNTRRVWCPNGAGLFRKLSTLLHDLKTTGLLQETLVLIGGEFGRTPAVEVGGAVKVQNGRDHNSHAFSYVLAGGSVKGGYVYGVTDDFGFKAVDRPVHIHDLHATVLYLMGLGHTRLTYRYNGRDFRLTDIAGNVVGDIIA
jgi:Protein of unknown function (DUF1501)